MVEYARVDLAKKTRTDHYVWLRHMGSNSCYTMNREPEIELRHNQLVRVLARAGRKRLFVEIYQLLDIDLLFHLSNQRDLTNAGAVILIDPFQRPNGHTDFIAVARSEADVEAAIEQMHGLYGQGTADEKPYDYGLRFGKRASTEQDFRQKPEQGGLAFESVKDITYTNCIDEVVLEACVEELVFRN
jgi:hypothetical protein